MLAGVLERTIRLVDASTGVLFLRSGDRLVCRAQMPPADEVGEDWLGLALPLPAAWPLPLAAERGQPVFIDDFTAIKTDDANEVIRDSIVRSFVTIPLFHDGEWIGNINVGR